MNEETKIKIKKIIIGLTLRKGYRDKDNSWVEEMTKKIIGNFEKLIGNNPIKKLIIGTSIYSAEVIEVSEMGQSYFLTICNCGKVSHTSEAEIHYEGIY